MIKFLIAGVFALVAGCCIVPSERYTIVFYDEACIKPYKDYSYLTCDDSYIRINDGLVLIPKNYKTDLASIPRWLWPFIAPANSSFIQPSILHDFLYSHKGYTRRQADDIFYHALINNKVHAFRAYEMYLAVRLFGGSHYVV